jgi:hypothetical protein
MHMQVRLAAYAALSNRRLGCPKRGLIAGLPHAAGTLAQVFEMVFILTMGNDFVLSWAICLVE